jgi:hypothetical protein
LTGQGSRRRTHPRTSSERVRPGSRSAGGASHRCLDEVSLSWSPTVEPVGSSRHPGRVVASRPDGGVPELSPLFTTPVFLCFSSLRRTKNSRNSKRCGLCGESLFSQVGEPRRMWTGQGASPWTVSGAGGELRGCSVRSTSSPSCPHLYPQMWVRSYPGSWGWNLTLPGDAAAEFSALGTASGTACCQKSSRFAALGGPDHTRSPRIDARSSRADR